MALDSAIYLVTKEIAMRSGTINSRYRIADGRFVLSNKDLAMVRLTSDEYLTGLQGVERISESDAQQLIAQNHFQRGLINASYVDNGVVQEQEQEPQTETVDEQTEQNDETPENTETETIEENEVGNVEDILGGGTQQDENNETSEEETETQQQNQEEE